MAFKLRITLAICILALLAPSHSAPTIPSVYSSYNKGCNDTNPCDPSTLLMCVAGVCQCESPSNQKYDKDLNICLSSVGGHCTLETMDKGSASKHEQLPRPCIKNAHCVSIVVPDSLNFTECQCDFGYIENSGGECVPGIGMPCTYRKNECNPLGMVVCKNERCACLDKLQVYDHYIKRCVSPAGTHCKYDSLQLGCVKNAICYPFYYWVPARCQCKPGYTQTISRTCVPENLDALKAQTQMEDL